MNKRSARAAKGFTLIELMIVVAIVGILAAIAIPKFADLINKSQEGATKGSLSALRSAIRVYYADNEGTYPADDLSCLLVNGKYLPAIPQAYAPGWHPKNNTVQNNDNWGLGSMLFLDTGVWLYWNWDMELEPRKRGDLWLACSHTNLKDEIWSKL